MDVVAGPAPTHTCLPSLTARISQCKHCSMQGKSSAWPLVISSVVSQRALSQLNSDLPAKVDQQPVHRHKISKNITPGGAGYKRTKRAKPQCADISLDMYSNTINLNLLHLAASGVSNPCVCHPSILLKEQSSSAASAADTLSRKEFCGDSSCLGTRAGFVLGSPEVTLLSSLSMVAEQQPSKAWGLWKW